MLLGAPRFASVARACRSCSLRFGPGTAVGRCGPVPLDAERASVRKESADQCERRSKTANAAASCSMPPCLHSLPTGGCAAESEWPSDRDRRDSVGHGQSHQQHRAGKRCGPSPAAAFPLRRSPLSSPLLSPSPSAAACAHAASADHASAPCACCAYEARTVPGLVARRSSPATRTKSSSSSSSPRTH